MAAFLVGPVALAGAPGVALAGPTASLGAQGKTAPVSVTLITGDKVVVTGTDRAMIEPGPGRRHIKFAATRTDGHLRVLPVDVLPLIRSDRLDGRLFDVTALIEFGYDDKRADLPLIVTGPAGTARSQPAGVTGVRSLPGGTAVRVAKSAAASVWPGLSAGVRAEGTARGGQASKIWLDGKRKPLLTESVPQIGAPTAWAAGFDGTGVKVAVVDSGIDADHPDLAGRVVAAQNFSEEPDTLDHVFHGTHVAATVASTGAAPGGYKGVAPGASLLSAKVCGVSDCSDSSIIAGMQWAAEQGAKVANVSLGAPDLPGQDPVEAAVERITAEFGMLFVVAAGNYGRDGTIGSPASADAALTVGAVDKADKLAVFSSRGPRLGDSALKPDITAPGVDITAALSSDADADVPPGTVHVAASGTSMAAPHVAGAAAILAQQHPDWTAGQLKAALMASANPGTDIAVYAQGAGRVDAARAVTQTVTTEPASVSFGLESWPHDDDTPDARPVTYRNSGTADVTFDLKLAGNLPAGLFTLSASTVTVPAGGSAAVTITSDTRANVPDGRYGGHVVATAGSARVVTPFAVDKEVESYELGVDLINRAGEPTNSGYVLLINLDTGQGLDLESSERITARVPKGRYIALGIVYAEGPPQPGRDVSAVVDPLLVVDKALTLTVDARVAKPISIGVPAADAAPLLADVQFVMGTPEWGSAFLLLGDTYAGTFVGQPDPAERQPILTTSFSTQLVKGPLPEEGPLQPSPYAYFINQVVQGRVPSGYSVELTERDLGRVEASYANQGVPAAETGAFGLLAAGGFAFAVAIPVTLPGRRTEFYSVQPTLTWGRDLIEGGFDNLVSWHSANDVAFPAGRTTHERINQAVFGPAFGDFQYVARLGNDLYIAPGMFSPAGNWAGTSTTSSARTVLERNGQVVFDAPTASAMVPGLSPDGAAYTLRVDATRGAPSRLSTSVSAEWTFRSGQTGAEPVYQALSAIRFAPPVDDRNVAPAGRVWLVPVEVQRQPGSAAGRARTLTVEVSYDDGATWRSVPVVRSGQHGVVLLRHPATAGFVSLRAASTDTAGNTVKQTVVRAYQTG